MAQGASCTITATFTPTASGGRAGSVTITDNAPGSPQTIALSGTGTAPAMTISPASLTLTFGAQPVGTTSTSLPIVLNSNGSAALTITSIVANGDFAQTNGCGSGLAQGASCTITATFTPTASGGRTGSVTITDNAPGSPQTITLSGTGADFSLAPATGSTNSATVMAGGTANFNLALAPGGGFNQTVMLTCAGAPSESTCIVSPGNVTLSPTTATTVTITVTTTAPSMVAPRNPVRPPGPGTFPLPAWWLVVALFAASMIWVVREQGSRAPLSFRPHGRVRLRLGLGLAILSVVMLATIWLPSCGGGSTTTPVHNAGTPAGTYHLNVAGTFASGTTSLTHNVQLTLTVN